MMFDSGYMGLGAVADYDIIVIKGKQYSVNDILDKQFIATAPTKVYTSAYDNATVKYTTQGGQSLGKVWSYLKPTTGRSGTWLQLEVAPYNPSNPTAGYVFVPADSADPSSLKQQGVKTVEEVLKDEAAQKEKDESPIFYYIKKLGVPVLLIGGGIYIVTQLGKSVIEKKL